MRLQNIIYSLLTYCQVSAEIKYAITSAIIIIVAQQVTHMNLVQQYP